MELLVTLEKGETDYKSWQNIFHIQFSEQGFKCQVSVSSLQFYTAIWFYGATFYWAAIIKGRNKNYGKP